MARGMMMMVKKGVAKQMTNSVPSTPSRHSSHERKDCGIASSTVKMSCDGRNKKVSLKSLGKRKVANLSKGYNSWFHRCETGRPFELFSIPCFAFTDRSPDVSTAYKISRPWHWSLHLPQYRILASPSLTARLLFQPLCTCPSILLMISNLFLNGPQSLLRSSSLCDLQSIPLQGRSVCRETHIFSGIHHVALPQSAFYKFPAMQRTSLQFYSFVLFGCEYIRG